MNSRVILWLLVLVTGLVPVASSSAQTASAASPGGSVTGRVQNAATGNYLNRARVALKGTDQVVYTDESGTFRLADVPAGQARL
ncbi:MAG: carboxypeptidase regulatory-like domain-containing protein, partial [Verrucomicrobiota bacterium]